MKPRNLKTFTKWFEYETRTYLKVFYYLRVMHKLDADKEYWTRFMKLMYEYGVFRTKDSCIDFVSLHSLYYILDSCAEW